MGSRKQNREARRFIQLLVRRIFEDHTVDLAATLAFYFLLSLFPLIIFLFAIIPYLGLSSEQLLHFLAAYLPAELISLIHQNLNGVFTKSGSLLSFGVIATIWPASNAVNALIRTLNRAYRVEESRSFLMTRFMAMGLTVAMVFAMAMTLAINVVSAAWVLVLFRYIGLSDTFAAIWSTVSTLVTFIVIIIIFAFLYRLGPNMRLKWGEVMIGSVVAGAGWQIASYAFSFYVAHFGNFSSTYGTLGGIIILMLWFYMTALTIIIGGQVNAIVHFLYAEDKNDY
ncbi:YihY/virulence factor BrkB family protein [Sporolactobacillus sp. THM7-7]|nr:YihY/virulence factor BrkB family protein [Sporolactobacillus sp. THM7-7]